MIYEFTIDPEVVATWHDPKEFRFFKGRIGLGTKRAISRYPGTRWKRRVMRAFHDLFRDKGDAAAKQAAKKRIDALLHHLLQGGTSRNRPCSKDDPWVDGALKEHARREFHGILTFAEDNANLPILDAMSVDDDDRTWNPPNEQVFRTADAIVNALQPMLRHARKLKLIDPYIEPGDERYREVLLCIASEVKEDRDKDESVEIQVHTSVDREFKGPRARPQTEDAEKAEATKLVGRFEDMLGPIVGNLLRVQVLVWSDQNADLDYRLHNRYVLCESGGVSFGHGLDSGKGKDTISVLSEEQWTEIWGRYDEHATDLRLILDAPLDP